MSFAVFVRIRRSHGELTDSTGSESLRLLLPLYCLLAHHPLESLESLVFRAVLEYESKLCDLLALFAACNFFLLYDLIDAAGHFEADEVLRGYQFQGDTTELVRAYCILA
jgi:hypothetical protein